MIPINKPLLGDEEAQAVIQVLKSGLLTVQGGGPFISQFERKFAEFIGVKYAISVTNGTAALHSALLAAGVGPGDQVIVPSFSFIATAEAVALTGAKPVFADIDPNTYCLAPEDVEEKITPNTKAIIPVHLYGLMADMDAIMGIARDHDLTVIEDAAHAIGAEYKGRKAGSIGDIACFSFHATKNMTTGEGGMITTNNAEYADTLQLLRNHGGQEGYKCKIIGHNYRMPEIEAAIGCVQLTKLPKFLEARRKNAATLTSMLQEIHQLKLPVEPADYKHSWNIYTIRLRVSNAGSRNRFVTKLREKKIEARVYYSIPIHFMPVYKEKYCGEGERLPATETACRQVFSLPIHPAVSESDLEYIATTVKKLLEEAREL
ncbi:DegT/DnrJ/EryC1/StrS family aminotransferase [Candidatus Bathyarchaeota archaeon]|nr:DegT/DnrJ/EryC1/StrS family aminotransferase [Candidatus Bathyarchaeota archaeon]